MRRSSPRIIILCIIVAVLCVNAVLFAGRIMSWASDITAPLITNAHTRVERLRAMVSVVTEKSDLTARVISLEEENNRLRGETSFLEESRREMEFYRTAAGISSRPAGTLLEAGIFSYNIAGGVRQVVVNRGSEDGVGVGDVVMTARGDLLGIIKSVFARHAVVWRVQDISFQVTARVSDSNVTGLARSDGTGSLLLDLVQKDEFIAEGARIVTSGDDAYPAGLVIGSVRSVDNNAATLFQIVHIDPAVASVKGPVLIVLP